MGISVLENKKVFWFLGFLLPEFLGFLDSWFLRVYLFSDFRFVVSGFPRFKNDQIIIPGFLEDIDPIFKFPKICLSESSSFFSDNLFEKCQDLGFPTIGCKMFTYVSYFLEKST